MSATSTPAVVEGLASVVVPVHERPELLRAAVGSALAQTYSQVEIVVVDDGSEDETPAVCQELQASHPGTVRIVRRPRGGPGAARESGRLQARGEFIQYLDSDDLLAPDKLAVQVESLRRDPGAGVAYGATREYWIGSAADDRPILATGVAHERLFPTLLAGRLWRTVTPLIRRSASDLAGAWLAIGHLEDWEYDARLAALGVRLVHTPGPTCDHRHHTGRRAAFEGELATRLGWRALVLERILGHANAAGVPMADPHRRQFGRHVFLAARQCGAAGLVTESRRLLDLYPTVQGGGVPPAWDVRLYATLARVLGWRRLGRLSLQLDAVRGIRSSRDPSR